MANTKSLARGPRKAARRKARKEAKASFHGLSAPDQRKFNAQRTKGKGLKAFIATEIKKDEEGEG